MMKGRKKLIALGIYFILLFLPIYWMLNMSLRTNADILGTLTLYPADPTFENYINIFTDPAWYMGYVNSIIYVTVNTLISLAVALPAAYAFSRYSFVGDSQVFFWLLTNRMAPAAVFALPFFPALLHHRPAGYAHRRCAGALSVQRAAGRLDSRGFHVRRSPGN